MKKFRELKMGTNLFSDFYSKFIQLVSDLKYILEMFIQKFKHKLILQLQDRLNFGIEFTSTISTLAKRCLSIYEQMQVINWIKEKVKSSITVQTVANILLRVVTSSFRAPTVSNNNSSFLYLSNILQGIITLTS